MSFRPCRPASKWAKPPFSQAGKANHGHNNRNLSPYAAPARERLAQGQAHGPALARAAPSQQVQRRCRRGGAQRLMADRRRRDCLRLEQRRALQRGALEGARLHGDDAARRRDNRRRHRANRRLTGSAYWAPLLTLSVTAWAPPAFAPPLGVWLKMMPLGVVLLKPSMIT